MSGVLLLEVEMTLKMDGSRPRVQEFFFENRNGGTLTGDSVRCRRLPAQFPPWEPGDNREK